MVLKCLVIDDDRIQRELIGSYIGESNQTELIGSLDSAVKAAEFLENNPVDLIFLDIEMPIMSGLEFLKNVKSKSNIILVTSKEKYALKSYDYDVIDYLLKPVSYSRFLQSINKVKSFLDHKKNSENTKEEIFVKANSIIEKINLKDIFFIKAAVDYVLITVTNNKFLVNTSMSSILAKLPKDDFMRVHRSYIVRVDKINKIDGNLIIINDKLIRISKSYKKEVMSRLDLI